MTLLNTGVLWGLLALAIPIIIHFFNLQRPKQILFSNIAFVKEVKKSVVRRVRFRQWLLLVARLLAIAALVLAFANPVILKEDQQELLQGHRSVAIVLDNSYSMTAGNEKGNYFQQAISLSRNIIKAYSRQDEFLLMTTSDLRLNYNFGEQEAALEELKALNIDQNIRNQGEILQFREEIFARANHQLHELYFLSDFQTSTVMADSQQVSLQDSSLLIKYIPLATREQRNVYVSETRILSQIVEKNKPVNLSMSLINDGNNPVKDLSLRVILEGKAVAISNHSLEANAATEVSLSFTPSESGWLSGFVELDDNPVDFDNRRYFSLYVPEREKVLVVEGQNSPNLRILYGDLINQFETEFIPFRSIASVQLNDYQSLILSGITNISSGLSDRLKSFLLEGGGIMFFPGEDMDLNSVNQFLESIRVGSFQSKINFQESRPASTVDLAHPIFAGVFQQSQRRASFDAPGVKQYHPIRLNNQSIQNRIMALENQDPILLETKVGNGILYTFSLFPGDQWTDFHLKTIFAPVIYRITQILNQSQNVSEGQEIGFFTPKSLRTNKKSLIFLRNENGQSIPPEQYVQGGATILNFEKMDILEGVYDILQEEVLLEKIAFNISDQESRLDFMEAQTLGQLLSQKGYDQIQVLPPLPDQVRGFIETEKQGFPLWKYFIIAALFFLVVEIGLLVWNRSAASSTVSK